MSIFYLSPSDNIQKILDNLQTPATIYLKKGVYNQKLTVKSDDVTVIGESRETTIVSYNDYAKKIHSDGREYNTFRTYTLCINGERCRLENVCIENFNKDVEKAGQCVALSVNAKIFSAKNCDFKSLQDTLFCAPFPDDLVSRYRGFIPEKQLYLEGETAQYFENCKIFGSVDYIFGCASALFEKCTLISLNDGRETGFVAAPAHPLANGFGFIFHDCDFISGGAAENSCYLARPWRDYGKCIFYACRLEKHIKGELFDKWNDTKRNLTARFLYCNLENRTDVSPVNWAKEISPRQAEDIISRLKAKF